jgi:hypothetical protein
VGYNPFDGSIIPSFYQTDTLEGSIKSVANYFNNDTSVHVGYVVGIHYPNDAEYTSYKYVTYDVLAISAQGDDPQTSLVYRNLHWAGGGMGDTNNVSRPRLRAAKGWSMSAPFTPEMEAQASLVAFACANGRTQDGYIIGVVDHPQNVWEDSRELGQHFWQSFNGINTYINKDGEYSVTFSGSILDPETNDYIEAPEATTGTTILMDKEGSILFDNVKGESIKLNKTDKAIQVRARAMQTVVSEKDHTTMAPNGKVTFLAGTNAVFNGKKIYIGAEGTPEPMVKGDSLADGLGLLIRYLTGADFGVMGQTPVFIHPNLRSNLVRWAAQYGVRKKAVFLSTKAFVE